MPRAIEIDDEDKPRRRKRRAPAAAAATAEPERGFVMRVLLHSPKDTLAGAVAAAAVIAIAVNAMFLQAGRHPAPMFGGATTPSPLPATASVPAPPAAPSSAAAPAAVPIPAAAPLPRNRPAEADPRPADGPAARAADAPAARAAPRPPAAIPVQRSDPLGDLIVSTRRIAAVQRALTEYGYGQLKPTGVIGPDTQAAIQKFERDRRLPVTGQISDRLIHDLVILTGRPIE